MEQRRLVIRDGVGLRVLEHRTWSSYIFIVAKYAEIIEVAFTLIIISAMAGGSATVLAGSRFLSMGYSFIILVPTSCYLISTGIEFLTILGGLGLVFGLVIILSARKAATFTSDAIHIKYQNQQLVEEMAQEKREVTRINSELTQAYEKINIVNSSLESEVAKRTEQIHRLSNLDPLTKLYNRNAFILALNLLLERGHREQFSIAVLFIDLDGFKQVNDALGHEVGDKVLRVITRRLLKLRGDGNIGRWGGDEFILAIPYCDEQKAIVHANRVIESLVSSIQIESLKLNVGASIGISLSPTHGIVEHELIQYADIAMYQQKNSGESMPRVFSNDLLERLQEKETLREGLREALKNNELYMVYQPIVDTATEEVVSCEALLRWKFKGKIISPGVFIEIAEQSGLIVEIGRWVLINACRTAVEFNRLKPLRVSVNVSMVQLLDDTFMDYLDFVLSETLFPPEQLIIEITESTFAENQEHIKKILNQIKRRNIGVSIDDFGTGYSSMSQLQLLTFDVIKIDRSFVSNIEGRGEAIVKATLFIAKELNCRTVAEGIETPRQAQLLRELGADYLQGFLYAKPLEVDQLAALLCSKEGINSRQG